MAWFVALLAVVTLGSALWCAGEILLERGRAWRVRPSAVALAGALAVAAALRYGTVPAHHAMYVDEPWYAEAACNLSRGRGLVLCEEKWSGAACVAYEKGPGWPVLLSPWALLSGCDGAIGIEANRLLGSTSVLLVALVARSAGATWWQGALAAALLAIHPVHVAWSATGETNVPAAALLALGLSGALFHLRTGCSCGALLAIAALGLASATRPELLAPSVAVAIALAIAARAPVGRRAAIGGAVGLAAAAGAASGLELWAMNEEISGGAFFSLPALVRNAMSLVAPPRLSVHGAVALLAFAGATVRVLAGGRSVAWTLLASGASAALAVLAYERFDDRMLLAATLAFLPLGALAFDRSRRMVTAIAGVSLVLLLAWLWRDAIFAAAHPPETQLLETRIAARIGGLPFGSGDLLIAAEPTVAAAAGIARVMAADEAISDPRRLEQAIAARPVYFLCDMFCEPGFHGAEASPCARFLREFALTAVAEEKLNDRTYALYRLSARGEGGATPPRCPRS